MLVSGQMDYLYIDKGCFTLQNKILTCTILKNMGIENAKAKYHQLLDVVV